LPREFMVCRLAMRTDVRSPPVNNITVAAITYSLSPLLGMIQLSVPGQTLSTEPRFFCNLPVAG
jgi:hypothetical protein